MADTRRSSTRAVSDGVSLPPSWLLAVEMMSGEPPRSAMPTAKDTRVRVDDLSKITATVCGPSSGLRLHRSPFSAWARSRISACSACVMSSSRRKWRVMRFRSVWIGSCGSLGGGDGSECAVEAGAELIDLGIADDERRRDADGGVVGGVHDEALAHGLGHDRARHRFGEADADEEPASTNAADERRAEAEHELADLGAAPCGVLHESSPFDLAEHRVRDRGRERIAAERGAVLSLREERGGVIE